MATVRKPARTAKPAEQAPAQPMLEEPVRESFEDVAERVREREAELTPARKAARDKHEQELLASASAASVESVVRAVGDLRVALNGALDTLAMDLMAQTRRLADVEEAITVKARHLAELHDIEVAADALADLVTRHDAQKQAFEEAAGLRERELETRLAARQLDFERRNGEAEMDQAARLRTWRERFEQEKAQAEREWAREQEEHDYSWKLKRTRDEEEFKAKRVAREAALAEEKARVEQQLAEREAAMASRETELADLRTRAQGFSAELERALVHARSEATTIAEERAKIQLEFRAKDTESTERFLKLRIQTLEQSLKELGSRHETLQAELRDATDKVRDIALKAIEGASGATALSRVSEIALQQARGRES